MGSFRFSSNIFGLKSRDEFAAMCRRSEDYGYGTIFAADHLGHAAPLQAVVAAAAATQRLRAGTLVINVPFWNPALLAREIATADVLTGGPLEVGLGSGHMKWEFDEAMASAGTGRRCWWAAPGTASCGSPRRPPASSASAVSSRSRGQAPGVFRVCTAAEADARVRFARDCAGERAGKIEWHALTQVVIVTDDRPKAAAGLAERYHGTITAEQILVSPFIFVGTIEEMAEQIIRDRYGFTYYTVHERYLDTFAPVIDRVRALET